MAAQGHIVYGAARQVSAMDPLKAKGVKPIALDVTNEESMKTAIETIIKNEGRIDVLVNNAGYGSYGAINVSSMGGRLTSYLGGWYHATKYAVEALSDALRMETAEFGIDVSIIEPGGIKTDWGFIAADKLTESAKGGAYEKQATKAAEGMRKQYSGNMMSNPKIISRAISKAINSRRPKTRYLIGFGAKPLVFLHTILPARIFDMIMKNAS